jgi:hypothetical protein
MNKGYAGTISKAQGDENNSCFAVHPKFCLGLVTVTE